MKKIWIILLVIALLGAGGGVGGYVYFSGAVYRDLNEKLQTKAEKLELNVSTQRDGLVLSGNYVLEGIDENTQKITYTYDRLCEFEEVDGVLVPPEHQTKTEKGSMRVRAGKVISLDGKQSNLSLADMTLSALHFDRSYFTEVSDEAGEFHAKVSNAQALLGFTQACDDMEMTVRYDDVHISEILVTYTGEGGSLVTLQYLFAY